MSEQKKWLRIATAIMNDLFLAFTAVSGNLPSEEGCTRHLCFWNHSEFFGFENGFAICLLHVLLSNDIVMCNFCLLASMEILQPNCSILYLQSNDINSEKFILDKRNIIAINIIVIKTTVVSQSANNHF